MNYALIDMNNLPHSKRTIREFPTYADAVAHAKVVYEIAVFAEDKNVDFHAADFLTTRGQQFAIEPINAEL